MRVTSCDAAAAPRIAPMPIGTKRTPACSAVSPCTDCRYSAVRKNMPRKAPPLAASARPDVARPRARRSDSGSSGADDAEDDRQQPEGGQQRAGDVEAAPRLGVARLADDEGRSRRRQRGDRDVDEEDPLPPELVDEQAADDDADRAAEAGQRAPDTEREVALAAGRKGHGDDRQGGGGEQRAADA